MAKKRTTEGRRLEEYVKTAGRPASLCEMSLLSVIPWEVYVAIKDRMDLALDCLEAGAENTAIEILEDFLSRK
jgi:hypothetical protein